MPEEPNPLELFTFAELWQEVCRRNEAALIVYERDTDAENAKLGIFWKGTHPHALGLADYACHRLRTGIDRLNDDDPE